MAHEPISRSDAIASLALEILQNRHPGLSWDDFGRTFPLLQKEFVRQATVIISHLEKPMALNPANAIIDQGQFRLK